MSAEADKPDFDQALARLEQIVGRLEGGEDSLEQSIALFAEAMQLCGRCEQTLALAEGKIRKLVEKAPGKVEVQEMESGP